jgi:CRP/FNR family transcriptional regulator
MLAEGSGADRPWGFISAMIMLRPLVIGDHGGEPCAHCDVRHQSVCSAIEDSDLARLAAVAVSRDIERGRVFIEEGEPATDFFNITTGSVKLFKLLPDGRQQVTGFAGVGHFLGLAVSSTYAFSAEAIEPVRVCRFSRAKLRAVLDDFPALQRRLLETACNELASAQEQMLLLGRKTARERLASFLMARARAAAPCVGTTHVHLPMTRSEIADYLGLTIETVSRTFSRFRAEHRIATASHNDVEILDRGWLEELAAGMIEPV